jgi:hypothetical protein
MGNNFVKEIEMVEIKKEIIGTCGLCETYNIPMEPNGLFCKYCYQFYFLD